MRYVLFYESAPDVATRAPQHFPAHAARNREFAERGLLLMTGPFEDAQADGAMAIFATREGAEEFVAGDPFVLHGVVARWAIKAWRSG